ncbi:MAG: nitrous oxide reductase accessory protein NosL [Candidatus Omnitrophica bacterium]|nr:nitrous oxide reductase accessory protein NosL [Candidatus Omnitrophota bacterium]
MRRLKICGILLVFLAVFSLAGCGERDLTKPPKIAYGRDFCVQCRMIIEEERFVSAAVTDDGHFLKFDDIGCLAVYEKDQNMSLIRSWVRDASGGGWIAREKALFVYSPDLVTPMGYGFVAFVSDLAAQEFAKEKTGRLVAWNELLNLTNQNQLKRED